TLSAPNLYGAMTTGGAVISSMSLTIGQTGQIVLLSDGSGPLTYAAADAPVGLTVDSSTGLVTFTPTAADVGTKIVTFSATNSVGTSTNTFTFFVSALTPTLSLGPTTATFDGQPHQVAVAVKGTDGVTPVPGTVSFTYAGSTTPPTAAGTYPVNV